MKKTNKILVIFVLVAIMCVACVSFVACDNEKVTNKSVTVRYVADGTYAAQLLASNKVDFIVVGEPAASAQTKRLSLNAEMNMQTEYANVSGASNYPQAGIFVQTSLASDEEFMSSLFDELSNNKTWVMENKESVTSEAKKLYESANFPAFSIDRCAFDVTNISEQGKADVIEFLNSVMPIDSEGNAIDWNSNSAKLFGKGDNSSSTIENIRFSAPEGTPALAILTLASNQRKINGRAVEYATVSPSNIASEMSGQKSQIVIMPVNAGANLIRQGADYKLVSIAVNGSLFMIGNTESGGAIQMDDLNGKTIACIGQTGVPGLVFRYVMQKNGFDIVTQ